MRNVPAETSPISCVAAGALARRARSAALVAACAMITACQSPITACTEIGCSDGVSVELTGTLPASYTVTLRVAGETPRVRSCTPQQCGRSVFFEGVTAEEVEIEIAGEGVAVTRSVRPGYALTQPNGPGCPPVCRQARVQLEL